MAFMEQAILKRFNDRKAELGRDITEADVLKFLQENFHKDTTVEKVQKAIPDFQGGDKVVTAEMFAAGSKKIIATLFHDHRALMMGFLQLAKVTYAKGGKLTEADLMKTIQERKPDVTLEALQKAFPGFEGGDKVVTHEYLEKGIKTWLEMNH